MPYTPAKFLPISLSITGTNANWPSDGSAYAGFPWRFNAILSITAQAHDDPNTSPAFFYDGTDVVVGDWIFTSSDGFMMKIHSISSQTFNSVHCVLEDVDQANIYSDSTQSQNAASPNGNGYLFSVNSAGYPIISPVPSTLVTSVTPQFYANIVSRFFKDIISDYKVHQVAHGFTVGKAIYLQSSGAYALADANNPATSTVIGIVSNVLVGPDDFSYTPVGPVLTTTMPSSTPGLIAYLSDATAGGLVTTPPVANIRKMFIIINGTTGVYLGGQEHSTGSGNGILSYLAQLGGGGGTGPLWVEATGTGVTYSKSAGNFTIMIPTGVELTSAKVNLQSSDTATLDSVPNALNLIIQYLDGSRNTTTDDVNYPTVTFVDESVISLGGTQPTQSTPYQFKPLGNSLSTQLIDISTPGGVGQATYRVQQLNFTFFTLILNF